MGTAPELIIFIFIDNSSTIFFYLNKWGKFTAFLSFCRPSFLSFLISLSFFFCLFSFQRTRWRAKVLTFRLLEYGYLPSIVLSFWVCAHQFKFLFFFFFRKSLNTLQDLFVLVFVVISQLSPLLSLLIRSVHWVWFATINVVCLCVSLVLSQIHRNKSGLRKVSTFPTFGIYSFRYDLYGNKKMYYWHIFFRKKFLPKKIKILI